MLRTLRDLSTGDQLLVAVVAAVVLGAFGVVSNAVMRDSGFGVFVNGALLLAGAVVGASVRGSMPGFQ